MSSRLRTAQEEHSKDTNDAKWSLLTHSSEYKWVANFEWVPAWVLLLMVPSGNGLMAIVDGLVPIRLESISSCIIQCMWSPIEDIILFKISLQHQWIKNQCINVAENFRRELYSFYGWSIHWIMLELMRTSCFGANLSQMKDYHWVPWKVAPRQVPTPNQQDPARSSQHSQTQFYPSTKTKEVP